MNLYVRLLAVLLRQRRLPQLSIWDTARTSFRVHLNDLDFNLHMNNGRYLTLLDLGRVDLMQRAGLLKKSFEMGWYAVVASQEITYRRSLKPFQKFDVATTLHGHDGRNVLIKQDFLVGDDVYASATVKVRWLKKEGGSVTIDEITELTGPFPQQFGLVS